MESPSPIEIISIDVPDTVLRKNIQNATNMACVAARHVGLEEAREKFINALVAENGNAKHVGTAKAAYPGLAKQIIATETGESQILDEVGFVDDDRKVRKVVRVQPRPSQTNEMSSGVATSSKRDNLAKAIEAKGSVSKLVERGSSKMRMKRDICQVGPGNFRGNGRDEKSVISSSTVSSMVTNVDNDGGRYECALSDFSVDKEDYRLNRYGLDDSAEDEVQDSRKDSKIDKQGSDERVESRQENLSFQDEVKADRKGYDEIHDRDSFSNDGVRCSNTQVLVLVSAMIHNPFDKEGATLIVEDNGVQGKGEITIYKGESDGSIDKLSLLVQSPVPSSVSDESTVKIQEIIDDGTGNFKEGSDDSLILDHASKRDVSLEIDGKYVKSVVNSRKSPRKAKNGQMRVYSNEIEGTKIEENEQVEKKRVDSGTQSEEMFYKTAWKSSRASSSRSKSPRKDGRSKSSGHKATGSSKFHDSSAISDERTKKAKRYDTALKGSLDSVVTTNDSRTVSRRRSRTDEMFSKKSKSCESIKKIQEACYEDPSKADSTSQLITANELDMQTDEFCSVCCYANEMSLGTEEGLGSPSQDNFYTLRSNCSSIADEDSTECDICSSWNLQESTDALDRKLISSATECDQLCEVCEICSEICATFNPDQETRSFSGRDGRDFSHDLAFESSSRSVHVDSTRMIDSIATDPSIDEESFEIENCGMQSGPESTDDRKMNDQVAEKQSSKSFNISDSVVAKKRSRDKYFFPKDELAILSSGARRMNRKGSLMRKKPAEDVANVSQDKRRYSSVDNLQLAKASSRSNDKVLRPKNSKLIGSADNIRASRSSRRCKSLQRSADNVRYIDSSTDNLDSLVESLGREDELQDGINWIENPRVRDNETVKMILTKHGIKIISEKETAL